MSQRDMKAADMHNRIDAITHAINPHRLWNSIMEMAKYGATANGGVNRLALTETDNNVRLILLGWINRPNYQFFVDAIGNLFIRRDGACPSSAPVMTGSHLDTQPSGGKFDGIYGVLAGLEVFRTLDDLELVTSSPLELAVWANEEGCRFVPGCMGSACFAKPEDLMHWLAITDSENISVGQAVAGFHQTMAGISHRPLGIPVQAYVEAHIEQGPILEDTAATIGIVSGIQGCRDFQVIITGMEAHAGTTPASSRQDAMKAAVQLLHDLYTDEALASDECRFTIGAFQVYPNSSSVVPGRVVFNIDLRHPLQSSLTVLGNKIIELCDKHSHTGRCRIQAKELRWRRPIEFGKNIADLIQNAADRLMLPSRVLPSGASHDAVNLYQCCPTGMIFVPCEGGISHNEKENAAFGDLHAGAQVLAEVLYRLAENSRESML